MLTFRYLGVLVCWRQGAQGVGLTSENGRVEGRHIVVLVCATLIGVWSGRLCRSVWCVLRRAFFVVAGSIAADLLGDPLGVGSLHSDGSD